MKGQDLAMLMALAAMWGGSFLFIRVAAPALGPFVVVDIRVLLAGLALLVYAAIVRRLPNLRTRWRQYLMIGLLNAVLPFTLISVAELHLTASLAAIVNACTPLFAALVSAIWLKDRLTQPRIAGVVLGLLGVGVLMGWSPLPLSPIVLMSVGASLLAAFFYALAGVYARITFSGTAPLDLAIGQQLAAGLILLPFAGSSVTVGPALHPSASIMMAMVTLALLCTSIAFLLYFRLLARVGPTKTLSVTFLVPVFGLFWSALFLHEAIEPGTVLGLAIILISVSLVTGVRLPFLPHVKKQRIALPAIQRDM